MPALALDRDILASVCRRQAVDLLIAFGSVVRGLRRPDSDLDLAVWMTIASITPPALVELEMALRPLFPGECLDLVLLNRASPLLQFQVARHGSVLVEATPGVFYAFQVLASKRQADIEHLRRLDRLCVDRFLRRQLPVSKGRVILGVGIGYQAADFQAFGVPMEHRAGLFEEGVEIIRQCWSGEPFSFHGTHYTLDNVQIRPRPWQTPAPPLWIGASVPPLAHERILDAIKVFGDRVLPYCR